MIELVTNTAAYLSSVWRDATNPDVFLDELILAQADIVIIKGAEGGTSSSSDQTTASTPAAVDNGNDVFSVPLTADDLNFTGRARVIVNPAGALPQAFDIEVVTKLSTAALADIETDTQAIEADTQDLQTQIGTAGAGLNNIPWNAAWDAEVESEVTDALNAYDPPTNAEVEARTLAAANYATAASLATIDGKVDTIETGTGDIQSRIPAALVGGRMDASVGAIVNDTTAASNLLKSTVAIIQGTVHAAAITPTTTVFASDTITNGLIDHYVGRLIIFTSGDLIRQACTITGYEVISGNGHFTVSALTAAPADDVTFIVV